MGRSPRFIRDATSLKGDILRLQSDADEDIVTAILHGVFETVPAVLLPENAALGSDERGELLHLFFVQLAGAVMGGGLPQW